jgi:hypothetical protein
MGNDIHSLSDDQLSMVLGGCGNGNGNNAGPGLGGGKGDGSGCGDGLGWARTIGGLINGAVDTLVKAVATGVGRV